MEHSGTMYVRQLNTVQWRSAEPSLTIWSCYVIIFVLADRNNNQFHFLKKLMLTLKFP